MKICLVGPTYPLRGGIAHYNTLLCRELRLRHEVYLVSLGRQYPRLLFPGRTQRDESREILAVDNDPILHPLGPLSWMRARRRIRAFRPELVLFQWWHPFFAPCFGTLARWLARDGLPTTFLTHNAEGHEQSTLEGILTRYALRGAGSFLVHSAADRDALARARPGARVEIHPHPSYDCFRAEGEIPRAEARAALGLPADGDTLLFFGYVRRYKGLPILLRAMARIAPQRDCRLLVVGEFYHDRRETLSLIRDLGLGSRVRLVDRYVPNEEVRLYFGAADLVVLPYRSASQSGVVQIAYAFRRPVVASRVGGIPEVVEEGSTGLLVPPEDPAALAGAILRFFREGRFETMARNIERYRERFTWDSMVHTVERIAGGGTGGGAATPARGPHPAGAPAGARREAAAGPDRERAPSRTA